MPYTVKINEKLTCPHRHRYRPERDGLNFRASCSHCQTMLIIYHRAIALRDAIEQAHFEKFREEDQPARRY